MSLPTRIWGCLEALEWIRRLEHLPAEATVKVLTSTLGRPQILAPTRWPSLFYQNGGCDKTRFPMSAIHT